MAAVDGAYVFMWVCAPTHLTWGLPVSSLHRQHANQTHGKTSRRLRLQDGSIANACGLASTACNSVAQPLAGCWRHLRKASGYECDCCAREAPKHSSATANCGMHTLRHTSSSEFPPSSSLLPSCRTAAAPTVPLPPVESTLNRCKYANTCKQPSQGKRQ